VLIPQAVIAEASTGLNRDPTAALTLQWATQRIVPNLPLPLTVAAWGLGAGKSSLAAWEMPAPRFSTTGRAARARGVSVIGTLGVILLAQQKGLECPDQDCKERYCQTTLAAARAVISAMS